MSPSVPRLRAVVLLLVCACAAGPNPPVRLDPGLPVGRLEGGAFTGIRVPFDVSVVGTGWELATAHPQFLLEQGYSQEGLEGTQLFAFHPEARSSIQFSVTPASPRETFDQEKVELLARLMGGMVESELDEEFGPGGYRVEVAAVAPVRLAGVAHAARGSFVVEAAPVWRENGWIVGYAGGFQLFILYQLEGQDPAPERDALARILGSFRFRTKPPP